MSGDAISDEFEFRQADELFADAGRLMSVRLGVVRLPFACRSVEFKVFVMELVEQVAELVDAFVLIVELVGLS